MLHLLCSSTEGYGPLPTKDEIMGQLREAGFVEIEARRAIPGEEVYAFTAIKNPLKVH